MYFDREIVPQKKERVPTLERTVFSKVMKRIERRAYAAIDDPGLKEKTDVALVDPFARGSPDDTLLWVWLLFHAWEVDYELYARLYLLRGGGTRLVKHPRWGYVLAPVIASERTAGWQSLAEYESEKHCLDVYRKEIGELLQELVWHDGEQK